MLDIWGFVTATMADLFQLNRRWTKGMTVANFERDLGMKHFGGTALEQVNYRHNMAMKLDYPKFCDLIVDAVERLTGQKIN